MIKATFLLFVIAVSWVILVILFRQWVGLDSWFTYIAALCGGIFISWYAPDIVDGK